MINLKNTCVLVRTKEENEKLLKEAEKQGFNWSQRYDCKPLLAQHFPDILRFYEDKVITYEASIRSNVDFYEASELLGTKEMTAREFVEWYLNVDFLCGRRNCDECVLGRKNTKSNGGMVTYRKVYKKMGEMSPINWHNLEVRYINKHGKAGARRKKIISSNPEMLRKFKNAVDVMMVG